MNIFCHVASSLYFEIIESRCVAFIKLSHKNCCCGQLHYTGATMKYSWIFNHSLIYFYKPFSCINTYRYQSVYTRCFRISNIPNCCGYRCNLVRRSPINPGSCSCWFSGPAGMKSVRNRHPVGKPLAAVNQAVPRREPQTVTTLGFKLLFYHVLAHIPATFSVCF